VWLDEYEILIDMERDVCDLCEGTILAFVWRGKETARYLSVTCPRFEMCKSHIPI
jgi:hypothetical protein